MKRTGIYSILATGLLLLSSGCAAGEARYGLLKLSDRPVALSDRKAEASESFEDTAPESDAADFEGSMFSSESEPESDSSETPSGTVQGGETVLRPSLSGTTPKVPSSRETALSETASNTESSGASEIGGLTTSVPPLPTDPAVPSSTGSPDVPDPYATGVVLSNGTRIYAIDAQVMTLLQGTYPVGQFVGKGIIDVSGGRDESGPLLNGSEYELYPSPEYDPALYTVRSGGDFTFHRPGTYKIIADCRGLKDSFYLTFEAPEKYITHIGVCIVDDPIARNGSSGPIYWSPGSDAWGEPMGIVYNGCTYVFLQDWIGTRMNFVPEWNPDRSAILLGDTAFLVYGAMETGDVINVTSGCTFSPDFFSPAFKELLIPEDVTVTVRYGSHQCDLAFTVYDRP